MNENETPNEDRYEIWRQQREQMKPNPDFAIKLMASIESESGHEKLSVVPRPNKSLVSQLTNWNDYPLTTVATVVVASLIGFVRMVGILFLGIQSL
ncbi:MAG: hypothetical protein AAF745_07960 [Planctomycetota bacterium]